MKQRGILTSGWFPLRSIACNHIAIGTWLSQQN